MKIEIFDVGLGQCAMIHCPNGKKIMIDAGHKSGEWWPSTHFFGTPIEMLVNGNFDEDHASDLVDVRRYCHVKSILRNPSVSSTALAQIKSSTGGMGPGTQNLYEWLQGLEWQRANAIAGAPLHLDFGECNVHYFYNPYPYFTKTNDLSLAVFVSYGGFTILFPGDLEEAGWENMLLNAEFRTLLARTTILVASHHGRDNGRSEKMFQYCKPQAIIISDAGMQHATQNTVKWYGDRAVGCNTRAGDFRKVFTTRRNGKITIDTDGIANWWIETGRNTDPLKTLSPPTMAALGLPQFETLLGKANHGATSLASLVSRYGISGETNRKTVPLGLIDALSTFRKN